jgi:flavodoxin
MKSLVVYDSVFGNTEKIALAIGEALAAGGEAQTLPVGQVTPDMLQGQDLLVVGSPTRGFRPTEDIDKWLSSIGKNELAGQRVAAFDTRFALESIDSSTVRFIVKTGGYAASTIAKELKKKGGELIAAPEGFLVTGEQGPLKEGELERAKEWGRGLGQPG